MTGPRVYTKSTETAATRTPFIRPETWQQPGPTSPFLSPQLDSSSTFGTGLSSHTVTPFKSFKSICIKLDISPPKISFGNISVTSKTELQVSATSHLGKNLIIVFSDYSAAYIVTRWLQYFSLFGYLQKLKFAQNS